MKEFYDIIKLKRSCARGDDNLKATVFDIQRFSVHDGPGIRTTVFMKGCPLSCRWCHNPEGLSGNLQLQFFEEKCISCGLCGERKYLSDAERCPSGALSVCGRVTDLDSLIPELLKDRIFYGENGGVTFSGGECLLNADFVSAALRRLKNENIHTAIDTCGCVLWSEIEKTLDCCDLYLYDIKCITSSLHKEYTGVSNTLILENLKKLSERKKDVFIRVPVIPGFNNNENEITLIADFVCSLDNVKQLTLMPYHSLGASKYKTLGLSYNFDISLKVSSDEMQRYKEIVEQRIIPAF